MAIIEKKIWIKYFDAVESGKKKYEVRLNDFDIAEGDTLILREWDKDKRVYTGRKIERVVTYVGKFGLDDLYKFNSEQEIKELGIQVILIE